MTGPATFPFSAIVGQERLKLGLILNAIHPGIGGLLIRGPKGTGKSTAVYALASLLPDRTVVANCPYGCTPESDIFLCLDCCTRRDNGEQLDLSTRPTRVISLPLSASEDRVVGAVDMDQLLAQGKKAFRPGILAEANHNFLYIDEINLLPDHLTDDILNSAASGWHTVEREGFSLTHPARFMLVGTMNPEEGELRPQLLDRLPLSVQVETIRDAAQRVEIAKRNIAFSNDPTTFRDTFAELDAEIRSNITDARSNLPNAGLPEYQLESAAEMCIALNIDGQRPEIAIAHTAMAMAAYYKRQTVDEADLHEACIFALSHRTRDGGFEPPATPDEITAALKQALKQKEGHKNETQHIQMTAKSKSTSKKKAHDSRAA